MRMLQRVRPWLLAGTDISPSQCPASFSPPALARWDASSTSLSHRAAHKQPQSAEFPLTGGFSASSQELVLLCPLRFALLGTLCGFTGSPSGTKPSQAQTRGSSVPASRLRADAPGRQEKQNALSGLTLREEQEILFPLATNITQHKIVCSLSQLSRAPGLPASFRGVHKQRGVAFF